jgi:hypothetical protein
MYAGDFNNTYYTSTNATSPTGTLFVCGNTSGNPTLYAIAITGGTMNSGAATSETALAGASATCSPITEVYNGTQDWIFLSVTNDGNKTASGAGKCSGAGAAGACVYSFNVGSGGSETTPVDGLSASGGSSGIIIDNLSSAGGSQIYYTTLSTQSCAGNGGGQGAGSGGCAVQASQSGLN